jgi:hypothetical protein
MDHLKAGSMAVILLKDTRRRASLHTVDSLHKDSLPMALHLRDSLHMVLHLMARLLTALHHLKGNLHMALPHHKAKAGARHPHRDISSPTEVTRQAHQDHRDHKAAIHHSRQQDTHRRPMVKDMADLHPHKATVHPHHNRDTVRHLLQVTIRPLVTAQSV